VGGLPAAAAGGSIGVTFGESDWSSSRRFQKSVACYPGPQDTVTERLDEVYSRRHAKVDPPLHRAQLSSLEKDSW
jgi:hypothetical protein